MKLEKAIKILDLHNKWRRDNDGKYIMADPEELGIAIDTVVNEFKKRKIDKHKLKEAFITYINYDIVSDERFNDPFDL